MIYTLTLNPALDKTVEINSFTEGSVNRISSTRLDAGGKGINVSKVLKTLGGESRALGILAGRAGDFIKEYLDENQIENDFVLIAGETRTNLKIVDKIKHENTDINEVGPEVSMETIDSVEKKLFDKLSANDLVVFSGSIPKGIPADIYGSWIKKINKLGGRAILDGDGEILKYGVMAGPYLVKPNIHELERMFDVKIENVDMAIIYGRKLLEYGIKFVALSLGGDGAVFINESATISVKGIKVEVVSTVGAGDSMVAALTYALSQNMELEEAIKLAVATGTANVMTSGTEPADLKTIIELKKKVVLEYL